MRKSLLLFLLSMLGFAVLAQQKTMSLEDAVIGQSTYLAPSRPVSLQWRDNDSYVYVEDDQLWQNEVKKDEASVILTLDDLNDALNSGDAIFQSFPSFSFLNENEMLIQYGQYMMIYQLDLNAFSMEYILPDDAANIDFNEESRQLAYTKGNNLYVMNEMGETQITHETAEDIICGQAVHRHEFGIEKGTFWSDSGKYLAFYRKDESMVEDYPMVDFMQRVAEGSDIKYPMAGMTSHQVTIGIYNTETGESLFLNTGTPDDHYLTNLSWGPNDEYIYMAELNRGQDHMKMNQYSVSSGELEKTLFEETRSTYVEPQHPIFFSENNPDQFYYWARTDGWFHIYLYNTDGELIRQVTKGEWEVTGVYGMDSKEKYLYYQSTEESPVDRHIYRVEIKSGKTEKLSNDSGYHSARFSPDMSTFIDSWSSTKVPGVYALTKSNGNRIRTIHENENTLADYDLGEIQLLTIKAADNKTDLYGSMILPNNFDVSQKYPVVVYVYGGPHVQMVTNSWHNGVSWWQYYLAANGYIVFTVDSRGSDARGQEFEEITHRQLGVVETSDQMKGIEYLESLPYVDKDRIGVHGWSFGGFMTLNMMMRENDTFKVGVAGGPVVDWKMYEVMYGERYMDTPQENPDGYDETNMVNHVDDLEGKLMLIHGVQDDTVVMQHSMQFLRECIKEGKQVDFFAYPTHPHNVRGQDRVHLMEKVCQYFFDYL